MKNILIILAVLLGYKTLAQDFVCPKNPEERIKVELNSTLKKSLKKQDLKAFDTLLQQSIGNFFEDYKDYKTAINYLEELPVGKDSLDFEQFKILVAGGYGTKPQLKKAKEIFEKANFKHWVKNYNYKNDLPLANFFNVYENCTNNTENQILLARYFLEYQISYVIGKAILQQISSPDALFLLKKWEIAQQQKQNQAHLVQLSNAFLEEWANKGSHLAKVIYAYQNIQNPKTFLQARQFLAQVPTDTLLLPKIDAIRANLWHDKEEVIALQNFYQTYKNTIWQERFLTVMQHYQSLDQDLQTWQGFWKSNQKYALGFSDDYLKNPNPAAAVALFENMKQENHQYLSAYLPIYKAQLAEIFYQKLTQIRDIEQLLSLEKQLNDANFTQLLDQGFLEKSQNYITQTVSEIILEQQNFTDLAQKAKIFDKYEKSYIPDFGLCLERILQQVQQAYILFQLKHDTKLQSFVQKIYPDYAVLVQNNINRFALSEKNFNFYDAHAQIQSQAHRSLAEARDFYENYLLSLALEKNQRDSLKTFLVSESIADIYGKNPKYHAILALKDEIMHHDWLKDIAQKVIFEMTSTNPNWFQGTENVEELNYFYEVYIDEKDRYMLKIQRKDAEGYNIVYEHYWEKELQNDFIQLKIMSFFIEANGTKRNKKNDYILITLKKDLSTSCESFGALSNASQKNTIRVAHYDAQALVRASIKYFLQNYTQLLK